MLNRPVPGEMSEESINPFQTNLIFQHNDLVSAIDKVTERKMLMKEITEDDEARFCNQKRRRIGAQSKVELQPTLIKLVPDIETWAVEEFLEECWVCVDTVELAT